MVKTMSDPVTNVEIEDVLSSIRRLVSGDERPRSAAPSPVAPTPARAEPDRLVLTPSLRVDDDALDLTDHEVQSEVSEMSMDDPKTVESPRDAKADLKARIAELEEVVSRQGDQWEPDGSSANANSGGPVAPLPWEECGPGTDDDPDADADAVRKPYQRLAQDADICAPRLAQDESAEPSGDIVDDPFADLGEDYSVDAKTAGAHHDDNLLAADEEFLDEDALRDLVSDIVRQELQGALGERITRNVRKLVRREIHRALTSQDLS